MNRTQFALLLTLVVSVAFLYRPSNTKLETQGKEKGPSITRRSLEPLAAPGFFSSYKQRDLEAVRDQSEIEKVSAKEPRGFERRLRMFRKYSRKILKTDAEVRLLHALVADEATQDLALKNLNSGTDENERIVIVDYLLAGLDEQKKTGRNALLSKVAGFLQSEVPRELDKTMIKSLAADRVELFAALRAIDPPAAERLMAAPKSELNKRIYQYAMMNYGKKGS